MNNQGTHALTLGLKKNTRNQPGTMSELVVGFKQAVGRMREALATATSVDELSELGRIAKQAQELHLSEQARQREHEQLQAQIARTDR